MTIETKYDPAGAGRPAQRSYRAKCPKCSWTSKQSRSRDTARNDLAFHDHMKHKTRKQAGAEAEREFGRRAMERDK